MIIVVLRFVLLYHFEESVRVILMKQGIVLFLVPLLFLSACRKQEDNLYSIGFFQFIESDTANAARKGFIQALEDQGMRQGQTVNLEIRNGLGDMAKVFRIAQEFVEERVDMIVAHSTPCLQAAMMATQKTPIVFIAVANPYIVNAGKSAVDHLPHITGVASTGPVQQTLAFIKEVLPQARRVGTLWTPSELNSEFYLELLKEKAGSLGMEVVSVPVSSTNDVLHAAQILISKKVDVLFPVSDNIINAAFASLGRVAEENGLPLFGSFLLSTRSGACAALGLDFYEMGYQAGQIVGRVKNGESPARIPFQVMTDIKLHINLLAAKKQGVQFAPEVLKRAEEIITVEQGTEISGNLSLSDGRNP